MSSETDILQLLRDESRALPVAKAGAYLREKFAEDWTGRNPMITAVLGRHTTTPDAISVRFLDSLEGTPVIMERPTRINEDTLKLTKWLQVLKTYPDPAILTVQIPYNQWRSLEHWAEQNQVNVLDLLIATQPGIDGKPRTNPAHPVPMEFA